MSHKSMLSFPKLQYNFMFNWFLEKLNQHLNIWLSAFIHSSYVEKRRLRFLENPQIYDVGNYKISSPKTVLISHKTPKFRQIIQEQISPLPTIKEVEWSGSWAPHV